MGLQFDTFVRKPFTVEAVEVTADNFPEIAELTNGTIRQKEDGTPFIQVAKDNTKKEDGTPKTFRIYVGFWITRMNNKIRAFSKKRFLEEFEATDA